MLERGFLGERAFGAKKGNGQRRFKRETGRHDFAEQAGHFLIGQRALVPLQHVLQHLCLALRAVMNVRAAFRFVLSNLDRKTRTIADQLQQLLIQRVDARSQVIKFRFVVHFYYCSGFPEPGNRTQGHTGRNQPANIKLCERIILPRLP